MHLGEVREIYPEIRSLGAEVLAVSFAAPSRVSSFFENDPFPFAIVSDPRLEAYRAFGLDRATVGSLFHPAVIGRYLKHMFKGWMPKKPGAGEDVLQLGGDFLLDAEGRLRYAHPNAEPTDRPSRETLWTELRKLAGVEENKNTQNQGAGSG